MKKKEEYCTRWFLLLLHILERTHFFSFVQPVCNMYCMNLFANLRKLTFATLIAQTLANIFCIYRPKNLFANIFIHIASKIVWNRRKKSFEKVTHLSLTFRIFGFFLCRRNSLTFNKYCYICIKIVENLNQLYQFYCLLYILVLFSNFWHVFVALDPGSVFWHFIDSLVSFHHSLVSLYYQFKKNYKNRTFVLFTKPMAHRCQLVLTHLQRFPSNFQFSFYSLQC